MEDNHMSVLKFVFGVLIGMLFGVIQAYAIDQSICEPGSKVVLYPNGYIMSCELKSDFNSNEITCKERGFIRFYENGQLETCNFARSANIGGQECKELNPISFYPDGKFKSCIKTN
jgi:hypothetical protein